MSGNYFSDTQEDLRFDFKRTFSEVKSAFHLESKLSAFELACLHRATFRAALCNIAFNGLGGCGGAIKPEREEHRRNLEIEFMAARNCLFASQGWVDLPIEEKASIKARLLTVRVIERNLAV